MRVSPEGGELMGGDRVPGPLSRFIPSIDEYLRARLEALATGNPHGESVAKVLRRARASWIAEFGRLDEIAVDVYHGRRGGFIRTYADAWLHADAYNKRLMRSAWEAFIRKYGLEEDPEGTAVSEVRGDP